MPTPSATDRFTMDMRAPEWRPPSRVQHAIAACEAGVQRVHIINGRVDEGLLAEVFSNSECALFEVKDNSSFPR